MTCRRSARSRGRRAAPAGSDHLLGRLRIRMGLILIADAAVGLHRVPDQGGRAAHGAGHDQGEREYGSVEVILIFPWRAYSLFRRGWLFPRKTPLSYSPATGGARARQCVGNALGQASEREREGPYAIPPPLPPPPMRSCSSMGNGWGRGGSEGKISPGRPAAALPSARAPSTRPASSWCTSESRRGSMPAPHRHTDSQLY